MAAPATNFTQQERELMQVNKHLNDRIAALESSLAVAEEAAIRRCAGVVLAQMDQLSGQPGMLADFGRGWIVQCANSCLALIPPKAEAAK